MSDDEMQGYLVPRNDTTLQKSWKWCKKIEWISTVSCKIWWRGRR